MYTINKEFEKPPMELTVGDANTSGRVYVPKELIGRKVVVGVLPENVPKAPSGISTEELIERLSNVLGILPEDEELIMKAQEILGELESCKHPDKVLYNDAVSELLEFIESANIGDMNPRQSFFTGATVGIIYQPHMARELKNKVDTFFDLSQKV